MPHPHVHILSFATPAELAEKLADDIAGHLRTALSARAHASMVVSGGSTPRQFFHCLSMKNLSWKKVTITLADERWVDITDPSSNENLVRSQLLQNYAAAARFVGLKNQAATAAAGQGECHAALDAIPRPFDIVILGMGNDGHTASLFSGAPELDRAVAMQSGRNCMALTPPDASFDRMTMTLPLLLDSREIILHLTGSMKKKTLEKALADGAVEEMPVRWILRQRQTPVRIFWAP